MLNFGEGCALCGWISLAVMVVKSVKNYLLNDFDGFSFKKHKKHLEASSSLKYHFDEFKKIKIKLMLPAKLTLTKGFSRFQAFLEILLLLIMSVSLSVCL